MPETNNSLTRLDFTVQMLKKEFKCDGTTGKVDEQTHAQQRVSFVQLCLAGDTKQFGIQFIKLR